MKNLLLSIIVPVYNAETYLEHNLNSLVQTELSDCYEVILIDDGSQDTSGKICDEFAEQYSFFKVIHQQNAGVSAARNAGIKSALGKYLMFVDSDDYVSSSALATVINEAHNNIDLMIFNYYDVRSNQMHYYPDFKSIINKCYNVPKNDVYSMFLKLQNNGPVAKLYFTQIIKKFNVQFPIDVNLGEDLIFNLQFLRKANTIAFIPEVVYMHVDSVDGLSKKNRSLEVIGDFNSMYIELLSFVEEMKLSVEHHKEVEESILQSITNYSGKLYRNGYSKAEIYSALSKYGWYNMVLTADYKNKKSTLRKLLLENKMYYLISKFFKK